MKQYTIRQLNEDSNNLAKLNINNEHHKTVSLKKISNEKLTVVSLFSGSGGLDLGFLATNNFDIIFANDFNKDACKTYAHNIGNHIICDDISNLKDLPQTDIMIGGPPCQGFSTGNPGRSFDDPRNQLFKEYARIINQGKPKLFLMENVSGMTTMQNGKAFELIKKELAECGYIIYDKILNAKDFGVPQNRRRVFIIGVREDIKAKFHFPDSIVEGQNYNTIRDTIINKSIPDNDPNHIVGKLTELNKVRLKFIPQGGSMKDCPPNLRNHSDLKRAMRRLDLDNVSYTIVHNNCDHYYHPTEDRRITIREMARIQQYPDNHVFFGSKSEQSKQVGNSVPIGLGKVMAEAILKFFKENNL